MRTVVLALGVVVLALALSAGGDTATAPAELVLSTNYAPLLYGDLFVVGADGRGRRNITHSPYDDTYPSVDPTRTKIAFVSNRSGLPGIWIVGVDGKGLRRVTGPLPGEGFVNSQPLWDPTGRRLLFDVYTDAAPSFTVWTVPSSGGKATKIAVGFGGVWSPTGLIAVQTTAPGGRDRVQVVTPSGVPRWRVTGARPLWSPGGLLAVNHDSGTRAEIFDRPGHRIRTVTGSALSWSPHGELLAHGNATTLWVTDRDGHQSRVYVGGNAAGFQLWWAPDGKTLAFSTAGPSGKPVSGAYDVATHRVRKLVGAGAWSPDGSRYEYVDQRQSTLHVAALGHASRVVAQFPAFLVAWAGSRRLVYVVSHGGEAAAKLHLVRATGGVARTLAKPGYGAWEAMAAWSPDGKRIAFSAGSPLCHASHCNRYYDNDIWVRGVSGASSRRLTSTSDGPNNTLYVDDANPAWSRDGREIAFTRTRYGAEFEQQPTELWIVPAVGGPARRLAQRGAAATWSPDGGTLAFASNGAIALVGRDGAGFRTLPTARVREASDVAWSPDGTRLAAVAPGGDAFTVAPDGSGRRVVGNAGTRGPADLEWSPDGARLAASGAGIRVIDVASGRSTKVDGHVYAANPRWSPDGRRVAYSINEDVFVVPATGGRRIEIVPGPSQESGPAWRPR